MDTIKHVLNDPLVIKDTNPPAPMTDATEEKLNADKTFIEEQKKKAQAALEAKIAEEKKARAQALADMQEEDANEDTDEEDEDPKPKSKFMQRKDKESQRGKRK
jgi:regulator of protease activity HflC (stomatin/prohibitin superfamily)